jgi:hypothetical protein
MHGPDDEDVRQLSLFAPLSAVATRVAPVRPWDEPLPETWSLANHHIELELAPPPPVAASAGTDSSLTRRQAKDQLRLANATAARDLARLTGQSHAFINAELNRLAGLRRITEATVAQLEARLQHAERWVRRL